MTEKIDTREARKQMAEIQAQLYDLASRKNALRDEIFDAEVGLKPGDVIKHRGKLYWYLCHRRGEALFYGMKKDGTPGWAPSGIWIRYYDGLNPIDYEFEVVGHVDVPAPKE